jgi:hypothetical protein
MSKAISMRKSFTLAAAVVIGLSVIAVLAGPGSAVPVESGKLPLSFQRLMESPVIQVKKNCKKYNMCTGCTQYCEKWKHSDYCEQNPGDASCCKHWEKKCSCVPCLDHAVPQ